MALINCPECGRQISNKATACPNCGYPLDNINNTTEEEDKTTIQTGNDTSTEPVKHKLSKARIDIICGAVIIVLGIIIAVLFGSSSSKGSSNKSVKTSSPSSISIDSLISDYKDNAYNCNKTYNGNRYYFYIQVNDIRPGYAECIVSGNSGFNGTYLTGQWVYFKNTSDLSLLKKDSNYKITATLKDFNMYSGSGIIRIELKDAELVE